MQLKVEKVKYGSIPCYVVYPIRETGKTVIFYHGWSSKGELQVNRAAFLAVHGYTVFIPDAVNHGERHALSDYYTSEGYDIFWKTISYGTFYGRSVCIGNCRVAFRSFAGDCFF